MAKDQKEKFDDKGAEIKDENLDDAGEVATEEVSAVDAQAELSLKAKLATRQAYAKNVADNKAPSAPVKQIR